jgi:hypothetical protein
MSDTIAVAALTVAVIGVIVGCLYPRDIWAALTQKSSDKAPGFDAPVGGDSHSGGQSFDGGGDGPA